MRVKFNMSCEHFNINLMITVNIFKQDVVDPVTMALPYIGKKITEAFNLIVNGFRHLLDNPMQAITGMSRAITE